MSPSNLQEVSKTFSLLLTTVMNDVFISLRLLFLDDYIQIYIDVCYAVRLHETRVADQAVLIL
jgi:hypothetical protein